MSPRLLLIVGLQKSGTTLLNRLIEQSKLTERLAQGEGNAFWGNEPVFSPEGFPCGELYQKYSGEQGHELSELDALPAIKDALEGRFPNSNAPILFNKNPYNTVRLRWIRAIFPEALIVAVTRQAVPNVFSLVKKHFDHPGRGVPPEEGWWGVKPRNWRSLVHENKAIQSAYQWNAVNAKLLEDQHLVDYFVKYESLCETPALHLEKIFALALGTSYELDFQVPVLECFNYEYQQGSQLQSKNRLFKKARKLGGKVPVQESVELTPFDGETVRKIEEICRETSVGLEKLP